MSLIDTSTKKPLLSKWQLISLLILLFHIGLVWYYYPGLPDQIPKHFGPGGEPDAWGAKSGLWLLPGMGVLMFAMMVGFQRLNLPINTTVKLTEENKERQRELAYFFVQLTNVFVQGLFLFLTYGTIQVASGKSDGLGKYSIAIILIISFVGPVLYMIKANKKK